jgi:hypothetical protein
LALLGAAIWVIFRLQPSLSPDISQATGEMNPTNGDSVGSTPIIQKPDSAAIQEVSPSPPVGSSPIPTLTSVPNSIRLDPLACLPGAEGESGDVSEVLAEGALRVSSGRQDLRVRLLGADLAGDANDSLAVLRGLVDGKRVRLLRDAEDVDSAGMLLRYVVADGVFVNYEWVRRGAALPALFPPGQRCSDTMLEAERQAREEGLGYWAHSPLAAPPVIAGGLPGGPLCDCNQEYQCTAFSSRSDAQSCYDACGDYRNVSLDEDNDGLACEQLP